MTIETGSPAAVQPDADWAAVLQTHTAAVFLIGDRAVKLKKPVSLGFLDFSTRQARLQACRREVELNRRLAPDVYLGVADVLGPDGQACDHLVVMRRMPAERRLSTLVRAGAVRPADVRAIARLVAAFHARARRGPEISAEGGREALRARWRASFAQVRELPTSLEPATLAEVERLTLRFLAGRDALFADRIEQGRVIDGHGDLLADDIFLLPDGPRILDCLEFDDRLRYLDQLDDASFLAMDLQRLGAAELAEAYMQWYLEFSGDPAPQTLRRHYLAYRAFVRVKVACLRQVQGDPGAAAQAEALLDLTAAQLRAGRVRLVLVGGLPGTGKSTLAGELADRLGMVLISSDRVRKELAGLAPERPAGAAFRSGIYAPARTEDTYAQMLARAGGALRRGESVVLDASWSAAAHRDAACRLAVQTSSDLVQLCCVADRRLADERIRARRGVSDADPDIAAAMAAHFEPWPQAQQVSTHEEPEAAVRQAMSSLSTG